MRKLFILSLISIVTLLAISCKNESKNDVENEKIENAKTQPIPKKERKILSPEEVEKANSVMYRLVSMPEVKKFTSYALTSKMIDKLSRTKEYHIVFAPSNAAIEKMSSEKKSFYSDQQNISQLEVLVNSHIVEGELNDENLIQRIKKNGKAKLKTLGGTTIMATQTDGVIVLKDGKGGSAKVEKIDVKAVNGQVFIIDGVLNI